SQGSAFFAYPWNSETGIAPRRGVEDSSHAFSVRIALVSTTGGCARFRSLNPRLIFWHASGVPFTAHYRPASRGAGFDRYSFDCVSLLTGVALSGSMRTIRYVI